MRILQWILGILVLAVVVLAVIGMMLPREVAVARSTVIDAPASEIWPHVANLPATEAWSPWLGRDPDTRINYSDPAEGVGATMEWASDDPSVGSGKMVVIDADPPRHLRSEIDFGTMGLATATYDLTEDSGRTTVTWGFTADMGAGPVGRWIGLTMDGMLGPDYERGLANLKRLVEGRAG